MKPKKYFWKMKHRFLTVSTLAPNLLSKGKRLLSDSNTSGYRRQRRLRRLVWRPSKKREGKVLRVLLSGRWLPRNQGWLNFWETRLVTVRKSLHRSCWMLPLKRTAGPILRDLRTVPSWVFLRYRNSLLNHFLVSLVATGIIF